MNQNETSKVNTATRNKRIILVLFGIVITFLSLEIPSRFLYREPLIPAHAIDFDENRTTPSQPTTYSGRVWVYGGSTVYGDCVSSNETIPAYLQVDLPSKRIENRGISANTIREQLAMLQSDPITNGDIVIFYDGVNDIAQALFGRYPTHIAPLVGPATKGETIRKWFYLYPGRYSVFCRYIFRRRIVAPPANNLALNLLDAAQRWEDMAAFAGKYAEGKGARFIHILQPSMFSGCRPVSEKQQKLCNIQNWQQAVTLGYPIFRRHLKGVDLSRALDGGDFYFDFCHVTAKGNRILAQKISDVITGR